MRQCQFLLLSFAPLILASYNISSNSTLYDCSGGFDNGVLVNRVPYNGCYVPSQGIFVKSVNVSHPYHFPINWKCWEELYTVSAAPTFSPWVSENGPVECSGTSSCSQAVGNTSEQCYYTSTAISNQNGPEITAVFEYAEIEYSPGETITLTTGQESCSTATETKTCIWNDAACHSACTSQAMIAMYGYKLLKCIPHIWPYEDKYAELVCIQDWVLNTPLPGIPQNFSCNGSCDTGNLCSAFPTPVPAFGEPASCFKFDNPITPSNASTTGGTASIRNGFSLRVLAISLIISAWNVLQL